MSKLDINTGLRELMRVTDDDVESALAEFHERVASEETADEDEPPARSRQLLYPIAASLAVAMLMGWVFYQPQDVVLSPGTADEHRFLAPDKELRTEETNSMVGLGEDKLIELRVPIDATEDDLDYHLTISEEGQPDLWTGTVTSVKEPDGSRERVYLSVVLPGARLSDRCIDAQVVPVAKWWVRWWNTEFVSSCQTGDDT